MDGSGHACEWTGIGLPSMRALLPCLAVLSFRHGDADSYSPLGPTPFLFYLFSKPLHYVQFVACYFNPVFNDTMFFFSCYFFKALRNRRFFGVTCGVLRY